MAAYGPSPLPALAWAAAATLYGIVFLSVESEREVGALLVLAAATIALGARIGVVDKIRASVGANERVFDLAALAGLLVAALWFHEEHFVILMMTTALLLMVAALGLTIQFATPGSSISRAQPFSASAATPQASSRNIPACRRC